MPQIHKTIIPETETRTIIKYYTKVPLPKLEGMLFGCVCGSYDVSHRESGECCHNLTGLCNCKQFIPRNLEIIVEITEIDVFEHEIKDHSERDSLNWHSEFNLWRIRNEKSSILHNNR